MKKLLCAFLLIGMSSAIAPAFAQSSTNTKDAAKKPATKTVKKAPAKAAAAATPAAAAAAADDEQEDLGEANIEGSTVTHYNCELGNKITTYSNAGDDKYMAIRWQNKVHRLGRIGTSTGANRFENRKAGLVWINIPSKAMLLDSKKGQQLANECRNPDQVKAQAAKS